MDHENKELGAAHAQDEHAWFERAVGAWLADGLAADELARFEAHRSLCTPCAALASDLAAMDARMAELFNRLHPDDAMEDRLAAAVEHARRARWRIGPPRLGSRFMKVAAAAAAVVVLGTVGYTASEMMDRGWLALDDAPKPGLRSEQSYYAAGRSIESIPSTRGFAALPAAKAPESNDLAMLFGRKDGMVRFGASSPAALNSTGGSITLNMDDVAEKAQDGDVNDVALAVKLGDKNNAEGLSAASRSKSPFAEFAAPSASADDRLLAEKTRPLDRPAIEPEKRDGAFGFGSGGASTGGASYGGGGGGGGGGAGGFRGAGVSGGGTALGGQSQAAAQSGTASLDPAGNAPGAARKYLPGIATPPALLADAKPGAQSPSDWSMYYRTDAIQLPTVRFAQVAPHDGEAQSNEAVDKTLSDIKGELKQSEARKNNITFVTDGAAGPAKDERVAAERTVTLLKAGDSADKAGAGKSSTSGQSYVSDLEPLVDNKGNPKPFDPSIDTVARVNAAVADPAPDTQGVKPATNTAPQQKIIRNGDMEFEVAGFDAAFAQVSKIVGEEQGYVSSTNSEKLPNGKMRGTIVLRVAPERLDALVMKLRALGDLKSQRVIAQDVTKQYTDLDSELRATKAMQERLLKIIADGKGEIKDLIEAEKQLGVYREKSEKLEGELRYMNSLIAMSTLSLTLSEKNIAAASVLSETQVVNMGLESEDVEKSYADAQQAIVEMKGRVTAGNLKKHDAGQLTATIECDIAPDAQGALIDRLRQLGTVSRLDIERRQSTADGQPKLPQARVEKADSHFVISMYNLANVAPRQSVTLNLAADDVEKAYHDILDLVKAKPNEKPAGRVVTSALTRPRDDQTSAAISLEVSSANAAQILELIRAKGEVMKLSRTENPDTANTTSAKQGFSIQLFSMSQVAPREARALRFPVPQVHKDFDALMEALRKAQADGKAHVLSSQLNEQTRTNVSAVVEFEARSDYRAQVDQLFEMIGAPLNTTVTRSPDSENTVDSKVHYTVTLIDEAALGTREVVSAAAFAPNVPVLYAELRAFAEQKGRVLDAQLRNEQSNNLLATLDVVLPRKDEADCEQILQKGADVVARNVVRAADDGNSTDAKVRLQVTLRNVEAMPPMRTIDLGIDVSDIDGAIAQAAEMARNAGGGVAGQQLFKQDDGSTRATVVLDVPAGKADEMHEKLQRMGTVRANRDVRDPSVPDGKFVRARISIVFVAGEAPKAGEKFWPTVQSSLSKSVHVLLLAVNYLIVGLVLLIPLSLLFWIGYRIFRKRRPAVVAAPAVVS